MQHNIKATKAAQMSTKKSNLRLVGLRLPNEEVAKVEQFAREQERSLSSLARICFRLGFEQLQKQKTDEA